MKAALLVALGVVALAYAVLLAGAVRRQRARCQPDAARIGVGFVTNFFDTLGIGSFATTTSLYRLLKMCDDRVVPGTLNVGHTAATLVQAFIFIVLVQVDAATLALMISAAVVGAWLGAGVVSSWPRRAVQRGMGFCLIGAATLMFLTQMKWLPGGGDAIGLQGLRLVAGIAGNFVLGALMTLGIGLYGPCLILISLLGMAPTTAFPIMMGACAFLMPVASARFIRADAWDARAALGLAIGGMPAVLLAAFIVKSLPLDWVRWGVVVVVLYTALSLLRASGRDLDVVPSNP